MDADNQTMRHGRLSLREIVTGRERAKHQSSAGNLARGRDSRKHQTTRSCAERGYTVTKTAVAVCRPT